MPAVDGRGEFAFHTQLKPHEDEARHRRRAAPAPWSQQALGAPLRSRCWRASTWTAGHALVAERFARGRVFIGGDAAHLFTPTGGLGYNTAVEDAVNLGWKLAAVLEGRAPPRCSTATRPSAADRRAQHRLRAAVSPTRSALRAGAEIEDDTPAGAAARRQAGEYLKRTAGASSTSPASPSAAATTARRSIVPDGTAPPPDKPNDYVPSACPGGRAPHLWLGEAGRSTTASASNGRCCACGRGGSPVRRTTR